MIGKAACLLGSVLWLSLLAQGSWWRVTGTTLTPQPVPPRSIDEFSPSNLYFSKSLKFNVYTFSLMAADSGRVRDVFVKAYRGELLLTSFRVRVDGAVVGAEVADLDGNRFPELYVYSTSYGSGSFGRVYAWQFLPDRKADVTLPNWRLQPVNGYMGHDSLWIEGDILCRKYPVYQFGDANAEPSGGYRMVRYKLRPAGTGYLLVAE
jgi:hypothetical protein